MTDGFYDVHPVHMSDINQEAHPGGGTEVVEVPSFEGLVEDQFEAHLRHLEVAYKQPTAVRLAQLSEQLEKSGNCSMAEEIDNLSYFYFVDSYYAETDESVILGKTIYGEKFASVIRKNNFYGE